LNIQESIEIVGDSRSAAFQHALKLSSLSDKPIRPNRSLKYVLEDAKRSHAHVRSVAGRDLQKKLVCSQAVR
jgi:hypothetical protein